MNKQLIVNEQNRLHKVMDNIENMAAKQKHNTEAWLILQTIVDQVADAIETIEVITASFKKE